MSWKPNILNDPNSIFIMQIWFPPQRGIQMIISGPRGPASRSVKRLKINKVEQVRRADFGKEAHCELDTRADTCCAGTNCHPYFTWGNNVQYRAFMMILRPYPMYQSPLLRQHGVTPSPGKVTSSSFMKQRVPDETRCVRIRPKDGQASVWPHHWV